MTLDHTRSAPAIDDFLSEILNTEKCRSMLFRAHAELCMALAETHMRAAREVVTRDLAKR